MIDILLIYIAGGLTAMLLDKMWARKHRSVTNPIFAFFFSWGLVVTVIFITLSDNINNEKWRDL